MLNGKTPGNDGLSKEFYEAFWNELKDPLLINDLKIFSKALIAKLKSVLPSLIALQQTVYVQNN